MKAYEFPLHITPEGEPEFPDAFLKVLPPNQTERMILLVEAEGAAASGTRTAPQNPARKPRVPGSAVGLLEIVSDSEEYLEGFRGYMP